MSGLLLLLGTGLAWLGAGRRDLLPAACCLLPPALFDGVALWTVLGLMVGTAAWWRAQLCGVGRARLFGGCALTWLVWWMLPADPVSWRWAVCGAGALLTALLALERPVPVERGRRWVRRVPVEGPAPME